MIRGGCKKGIFVTSSTFSGDARKGANELREQKLKLIDGVDLAKLMIEFSIGVQVKERIIVSKIDQDFFIADD